MNAPQIYAIRKSFAELARHGDLAGLVFYRRLFRRTPALSAMFKSDLEQQAAKLMDMLGILISQLGRPAVLEAELRALGARHAGYGVRAEHYRLVGTALLEMLEEVLGRELCTPEVKEAWAELYEVIARAMQQGADQACALPVET